jgi:hypothetical protein
MTTFSKTGKTWSNDFQFKYIDTLDNVDLTANNIQYYHHPYDSLFHKVSFVNAVDDAQFEHIRSNPTVTLVHENNCEAIDIRFAEEVYQVIATKNINPQQIKVITADANHKNFLNTYLESKGITNTNITVDNYLLSKVETTYDATIQPTKKFSALSRNYRDWRLFLYEELYRHDLLKDFIYSFHNIFPYADIVKEFSVEHMITDLANLGVEELPNKFKNWLKQCPHDISSDTADNVKNKWSNVTYNAIRSADFHLTVETHFDQKSFTGQTEFDKGFGPSSITEKAYKPIACERPFILFATPFFLEDLRKLGYKTFNGLIDESYDTEINNFKRLNMIIAEINRLCKLPTLEYQNIVTKCGEIAKYNFRHLKELQQ